MEKAIAHPSDSCLLERCRERLVKAAARHGLNAIVDRGYKGVAIDGVKIYHPGLRRGITRGFML